jgi:hypothetical protein
VGKMAELEVRLDIETIEMNEIVERINESEKLIQKGKKGFSGLEIFLLVLSGIAILVIFVLLIIAGVKDLIGH